MGDLPFEKIKREILLKKEAQTSDKFGFYPENRTVEELMQFGVINIDKPAGPTSHQVSAYLQKILNLDKAGHSGTLDPNVTGVLPITLNKSTKIVQTLLKAGKEYICLMHLHRPVEEFELYKVFEKFTGKIKQLPPIKSAVKRQIRERRIYYIELLDIIEQDVLFKVGCQAGTYIRKLVHDMGQELKVGAHMAQLRRTKAGPFNETSLFTLQDVSDAYYYYKEKKNDKFIRRVIMSIERAVSHLPKIWVIDTAVDSLCHGASLAVPGISKLEAGIEIDELVAIYTLKNEFICFGRAKMSSLKMMGEKGLAVKTDKVVMAPGIYPRFNR
ncbi:RNA-guided pseudouridylation complex pseudouridine synthase subunit Cbf5 [archaeon]|jgi:H/ACA ribonucleoprotein complex subunit 4|nr:RNA-guided pseudouridylation complex pseudouridine synthase subunit Cbf5 [archaeon]MBT4021824.1 RNA-guided pseudouridylation complex pseudouridine synthase subunit Cbf5 [archaeon]MBT4272119.1 RNA-guided pseudouridylation complex pseudouridine synthase subunit Cbf5 [archaeon]MBT4460300.1 RNA-guided pseudouridylation complex pseudouridine synthase subunit Cbf5 [archaeon]MBT4858924.1 RNA-guided pseudouridylation complex pseudouridine synthase subunit Cbf5 [archaeon]